MKIHHLKPAPGSRQAKTRKGRGEAAGKGKTAGRGMKGTGARGTVSPGFEGGQLPLQRRLPKRRGFTPRNKVTYAAINVGRLADAFDDGAVITPETLREQGLTRKNAPVKILGGGEVSQALTVSAHAVSASARQKIEASGGTVNILANTGPSSAS